MSSNGVTVQTPELTGVNYSEWSIKLRAFLQAHNLWSIVSGTVSKPQSSLAKWENKDKQATGYITLCLHNSLLHHVTANITSKELWDNLQTAYGKAGTALIYSEFQSILRIRIAPDRDPTADLNSLRMSFSRLTAADVKYKIADELQAMILLAALPSDWDGVASTILATTKSTDLKFDSVSVSIKEEYIRRSSNLSANASRISGLKRKGDNPGPSWNNQKGSNSGSFKPKDSGNSNNQNQSRKRRGRGSGRGRGGNSRGRGGTKDHSHSHSQYAQPSTIEFATPAVFDSLIPTPSLIELPIYFDSKPLTSEIDRRNLQVARANKERPNLLSNGSDESIGLGRLIDRITPATPTILSQEVQPEIPINPIPLLDRISPSESAKR